MMVENGNTELQFCPFFSRITIYTCNACYEFVTALLLPPQLPSSNPVLFTFPSPPLVSLPVETLAAIESLCVDRR